MEYTGIFDAAHELLSEQPSAKNKIVGRRETYGFSFKNQGKE